MKPPLLFQKKQAGYTLLELSIVLVILSVIMAFALPLLTQNSVSARNADLVKRLDTIEKALVAYRLQNDRLPCPAGYADAITAAGFAAAAGDAGTCTGAAVDACDGSDPVLCHLTTNVVSGVVPVRTLGLPDAAMLDPWGRRFSYVVDVRMTATAAFTGYPPEDKAGSIEVRDEGDVARTTYAIAVVFSHGPNGHGAYSRTGTRISESVTNTMELANCKCTNAAAKGTFNNRFYQRSSTAMFNHDADIFDDALRYYTRGNFLSATDR